MSVLFQTHTHARMHARTHTHTHTHARTHARTHAHTHTRTFGKWILKPCQSCAVDANVQPAHLTPVCLVTEVSLWAKHLFLHIYFHFGCSWYCGAVPLITHNKISQSSAIRRTFIMRNGLIWHEKLVGVQNTHITYLNSSVACWMSSY